MQVERVLAVLLTACAALATGALASRRLGSGQVDAREQPGRYVPDAAALAEGGRRMGPATARVHVVDFSDFQCRACRSLAISLATLRREYPDDLATTFRHFPIARLHPSARLLALAAECAAEQGHFEAAHDALFAAPEQYETGLDVDGFAAALPDSEEFANCVTEERYADRIAADSATATTLGITGTPLVVLNDSMYSGAPPLPLLRRMVTQAVQGSVVPRNAPGRGTLRTAP